MKKKRGRVEIKVRTHCQQKPFRTNAFFIINHFLFKNKYFAYVLN